MALPVPLVAAAGLSLPLPATVARLAAKLVPFGSSAAVQAGRNGSIVRTPGERHVTFTAGPLNTSPSALSARPSGPRATATVGSPGQSGSPTVSAPQVAATQAGAPASAPVAPAPASTTPAPVTQAPSAPPSSTTPTTTPTTTTPTPPEEVVHTVTTTANNAVSSATTTVTNTANGVVGSVHP